MKILAVIGLLIMLVIGFGYCDAYHETEVDVDVRAGVSTHARVDIATWEAMLPFERWQLWARVAYTQPKDMRVSSIRIYGDLLENGRKVSSFDAPCQRGDSTWLADADEEFVDLYLQSNYGPMCFIKLDTALKFEQESDGDLYSDKLKQRLSTMTLRYGVNVKAANRPMRYVIWINEKLSKARDTASEAISALGAPFKRT